VGELCNSQGCGALGEFSLTKSTFSQESDGVLFYGLNTHDFTSRMLNAEQTLLILISACMGPNRGPCY
jgi:hypothetical protein